MQNNFTIKERCDGYYETEGITAKNLRECPPFRSQLPVISSKELSRSIHIYTIAPSAERFGEVGTCTRYHYSAWCHSFTSELLNNMWSKGSWRIKGLFLGSRK